MTTQQLIDDLFREGVPYAESLNSRIQQVLVSMGGDSAAIAALFRDYFPYASTFNSRLRTGLELVGVSAVDTADLFADGKNHTASLNERLLYAFAHAGPSISFTGSIAEGATTGRSAGTATLANPPVDIGTLTWSELGTGTGAALFAINSSTGAVTNSAALDYETATSYTYGIQVTDGVYTYTLLAPISVTNVLEVTLGALTLSSSTATLNASTTITLTGETSGSTFSIGTGALPTGMSINASTGDITGTPTVEETANFTVVETHPDGSNSPRSSSLSITVSSVVAPTIEIVFVAIEADSTEVGVLPREAGDTNPANAYNWRTRAPAGISTSLPYDQAVAPDGTSYLAWSEGYVKQNITNSTLPTYVMPHGWSGTRIVDVTPGDSAWGVGRGNHESSITRANTAVAAILAANPGAVPRFTILVSGGTNDDATTGSGTWETNITAAVSDFRSRVYKNGVSGATIGTDAPVIFRGMSPEFIGAYGGSPLAIEHKMRSFMHTMTNARYWKQPEGQGAGDNVHPGLAGQRNDGIGAANIRDTTTAPVITFPSSFSIYSGQKLAREITTNILAHLYLTGTDAAQFEIHQTKEGNGDSNVNNSRAHWYLRWTGNGDAPAAGTYSVTINAKGNAPTAATQAVTVTVTAAYGSAVESIVASNASLVFPNPPSTGYFAGSGYYVAQSVSLKRGFNHVNIIKSGGSYTDISSCVASNGLVGVKDANAVDGAWPFYFYSAQDETVDLYCATDGAPAGWGVIVTSVVGTVATPSASEVLGRASRVQQTAPMTRPTDGIIIGGGFCTTGTTEVSGCTQLNTEDGFWFSGFRTTTGVFGISNNGDGGMAAVALAKA